MRILHSALGALVGLLAGFWLMVFAFKAGMPDLGWLGWVLLLIGAYGGLRLGHRMRTWWSWLVAASLIVVMLWPFSVSVRQYLYFADTWRGRFQRSQLSIPKPTPELAARYAAEAAAKAAATSVVRELPGNSDAIIAVGGPDCESNRLVRATLGTWQAWYWYSGHDNRVTATLSQEELFKRTARYMPPGARFTVGQFSSVAFTYEAAGQERRGDLVLDSTCGLRVAKVYLFGTRFALELDAPLALDGRDQRSTVAEEEAIAVARKAFGSDAAEASAIGLRGGSSMVRMTDGHRTAWYWIRGGGIAADIPSEELQAAIASCLPQPGPVTLSTQDGPPYQVTFSYGQGGTATALLGMKNERFVLSYLVLNVPQPPIITEIQQPFPQRWGGDPGRAPGPFTRSPG
jgi:hypothetical protein